MKMKCLCTFCTKKIRRTHSIDVLWSGCVGSIGPVALKGKVVFGSERDRRSTLMLLY